MRGGVRRGAVVPRSTSGAAVLLAVVLAAGGCAPGTPDADSWRDDAVRSTGDVVSSVSTMALALAERDTMPHRYLRRTSLDAEEAADLAAQKLAVLQPPHAEAGRHERVTTDLDDAVSLLTTVRAAVVEQKTAEYAELLPELERTTTELQELEKSLHEPAP